MGPGEIRLLDGDEHVEIAYADDGAVLETCRSHHPHPLAGLAAACAAADSNPTELLARWVASLDPARHGPGRVLMPAAMPNGPAGVWSCGLRALRSILFADGAPRGGAWAVADGLTGTAIAFGATAEEALARWRAEVIARPPWPKPGPAAFASDSAEIPPGAIMLRAPSPDVRMPDAKPDNVPAAIVPLQPAPEMPPGFGSWTTLLGARGASRFAACRRKRKGFTLIGQHVLAGIDHDRLAVEMDRVDSEHEARLRDALAGAPGGVGRWPCRTTTYRVDDGGRLAFDSGGESAAWHAGALDGDVVAHRVLRQRWVGPGEHDADA